MRNIKLNKTYITTFGKEFTPTEKLPPEKQKINYYGNINKCFTNKETKFKDIHGNIIKKSKLWFIKGETPSKRPIITI